MSTVVVNIPENVVSNRMLSKKEAAAYCRLPVNKFSVLCPVRATQLADGIISYDLKAIDRWIDSKNLNSHSQQKNDEELADMLP